MTITITEAAARHIRNQLIQRGKGCGIRVAVRTSGCSGMAYVLEFVDETIDSDLIFKSQGLLIYADQKNLPYLDGTELDFVSNGLSTGFQFNNPNANSQCGCGESFNT